MASRLSPPVEAGPMLLVGVIGLLANVVSLAILAGGRDANLNMKAAFLEVANDALGSLAVIVAAGAEWAFGWTRADAIASLLIAILMAPRALTLLRRSVAILMEETPASVDMGELRTHMMGVDGVIDVHDLHVAAVSSHLVTVTAHVTVTHEADGPRATASSTTSANARATTSPSRTPRSSSSAPSMPATSTSSTKTHTHEAAGPSTPANPPMCSYKSQRLLRTIRAVVLDESTGGLILRVQSLGLREEVRQERGPRERSQGARVDRVLCWRHHRLPCAQHCRVREQTPTRCPFTMSARLRERAALWWTHTFASPSVQE